MHMKKLHSILSVLAGAYPYAALAQGPNLGSLIDQVLRLLNSVIPIIMAIALIYFMWGMTQYIKGAGDAKQEGRQIMIWGIIALFVMTSVFGLVNVLGRTLNLNNQQPNVPQLRVSGSGGSSSLRTRTIFESVLGK